MMLDNNSKRRPTRQRRHHAVRPSLCGVVTTSTRGPSFCICAFLLFLLMTTTLEVAKSELSSSSPSPSSLSIYSNEKRILQDDSNSTTIFSADMKSNVTETPEITDAATTSTTVPGDTTNTTTTLTSAPETDTSAPAETTTIAPAATPATTLLEMPASIDIMSCRKHMKIADADRNNLMNEEEYVKFVHEIVVQDFNYTLLNLPSTNGQSHVDVWGNTLETLPLGVQTNYRNLNRGGVIEIKGYNSNSNSKPTAEQELFLIKVCTHTEIAVHQVFYQLHQGVTATDIDTTQQVTTIPQVEAVTVFSSFELSNTYGIKSENLISETSTNRQLLGLAYRTLVTRVVSAMVGVSLTPPTGSITTTRFKSPGISTSSGTARDSAGRHRRRDLLVTIDPQLPQIYEIIDTTCPGASTNQTASLQKEWCQTGYGKSVLYLIGEDPDVVTDDYSQAIQTATANGEMEEILRELTPADDPPPDIDVLGAGMTILPPEPTIAPTPPPHPAPTVSPQNITVPEATLVTEEVEESSRLGLILILAGVLGTVNCLVITVSVYECWRHKKTAEIILGDEEETNSNDKRKNMKKKQSSSRSNRTGSKRRNVGGASSKRSMAEPSFYDEEEDGVSNPPTMEDIEEANRMPSPAPLPAPMTDDDDNTDYVEEAERAASAPTMEEIEAKLASSGGGEASSSGGGVSSRPVTPASNPYKDDVLPVKSGEMA